MALETGTYISDLVTSNPPNTDGVSQADDHLRLIKSTVKATFPNITGAVTATHTDLNKLTSSGNPQFATIELGAASDTTLSRSAAGVVAVEGVTVPLNSITNTHTALQIELGHASDTTITRSAAGVLAVEGGVIPKENRANTFTANQGIGVAPTVPLDMVGEFLMRGAAAAGSVLRITPDAATGANGVIIDTSWQTGGGGPLIFKMSSTERMRIDASGNVGIGGTPTNKLDVSGAIRATGVTTPTSGAGIEMFYNTNVGYIIPYDRTAAAFKSLQIQALDVSIFASGSNRFSIDPSGNTLNVSTGGLGYGTGSGGTVTQITSKNTGVTLNKTNGQIVTHNANLTAGNTASFTVTNSTVAATDTIIVHLASGGTAERYNILVDAVAAGSFVVTIHNYSSGALAQALTLNFAVIKAVTA